MYVSETLKSQSQSMYNFVNPFQSLLYHLKNTLNLHNLGHPALFKINHLPIENQKKSQVKIGTVFNDLINLALTIQVNRLIIYFQDDEAILQMGIFLEEHVHMLPLANTTVGYFQAFSICLQKKFSTTHSSHSFVRFNPSSLLPLLIMKSCEFYHVSFRLSTFRLFQIAYEGDFRSLFTLNF